MSAETNIDVVEVAVGQNATIPIGADLNVGGMVWSVDCRVVVTVLAVEDGRVQLGVERHAAETIRENVGFDLTPPDG